jgi:hypothetical protein
MTFKKHLVIVGFYALIAFCALHNPIAHMTAALPGTSPVDYYHFHWNYWWIRHALTTPDLNVYITNYAMAPFTSNLAYHTLAAFWFPIWALLEPIFGTLVAMMTIIVVAFTLAGYSFFLLLRREGAAIGLALVGGVMLQLIPNFFIATAYTNMNLLGWFWLPTLLLIWGKIASPIPYLPPRTRFPLSAPHKLIDHNVSAVERGLGGEAKHERSLSTSSLSSLAFLASWRFNELKWTLILVFALYGMVMTDLQYPLFAAFLVVPYGLYTLWHSGTWARRLRVALIAILAVAIAVTLLWFIGPLPYILNFNNEGLSFTFADQASALPFPSGYFYQIVEGAPIGYLAIPLLLLAPIVSIFQYRQKLSSQASTTASVKSLSTAPHAQLQSGFRWGEGFRVRSWRQGGEVNQTVPHWFWLILIPLPLILAAGQITPLYLILHQLLGGMFRYPERFQAVFLIPSVMFAMLTLTPIIRRSQAPLTAILLIFTLGAANIFHSLPVQPAPPSYAFYEAMGREPYDYVVVDIPTAGASGQGIVGEAQFITTMFYGITHGKRMTNGHISRVNTWQYMYMRDGDPLMSWLGQRRLLEPDVVEAELRDHIFNYPIGYFVIHTRFIDPARFPTVIDEITSYFNSLPDLLCPYTVENDAIVYRTTWHPDGCVRPDGSSSRALPEVEPDVYQLDIGAPQDVFNIGVGWHWQETVAGITVRWMGAAPQTPIYVDLPPASYEMTFVAQAYVEPRTVQILVNGTPVGDEITILSTSLQNYSVTIPAELVSDGHNLTVAFAYDTALVPAEIGQGDDTRALALMVDTVRFARVGE